MADRGYKRGLRRHQNKVKPVKHGWILTLIFSLISLVYIYPLVLVLINSFKKKAFISRMPFSLPDAKMFVGWENYTNGLKKINFASSFANSLIITVLSVLLILLCTSMCAWFITRVQTKLTRGVYLLCLGSMIVPFQMVMFTLSKTADFLKLNTPFTIPVVYLGFGAGLAVFMFCGYMKSCPLEIEESAMVDGCTPVRTFFSIVMPILQPTYVTTAILETMWIWNDYLLPYLVLNLKKYKTIPIAIQYLKGGYGSVDMGAMMAMLVLSILPIIILYLFLQKYIIKGMVAGAVKG